MKHAHVAKINAALQRFLWQGKRARISLPDLCIPKCEGGLGLPNIRLYNMACLLRYAIDWISLSLQYTNVHLEEAIVGRRDT